MRIGSARRLNGHNDRNREVVAKTLVAPIAQAGLVDEYRIVVATTTGVGGGTPDGRGRNPPRQRPTAG